MMVVVKENAECQSVGMSAGWNADVMLTRDQDHHKGQHFLHHVTAFVFTLGALLPWATQLSLFHYVACRASGPTAASMACFAESGTA